MRRSSRPSSCSSRMILRASAFGMQVEPGLHPIRQAEVGAMRKMIDRTEEPFGIKPDWSAADTAYGSSGNLVWLTLKRQILLFTPVFDTSKRKDGIWSRADFTRDEDNDRYICPEGKDLRHTRRNYSDPARNTHGMNARNYGALKSDCQVCPSKAKCCSNTDTRRIVLNA